MPGSCLRRYVDVNPDKFYFSCVSRSQFVQNWCLSAAIASPGGRKFHKDRSLVCLYLCCKIEIRYADRFIAHGMNSRKPCSALSTDTHIGLPVSRNTVFCCAPGTCNYYALIHELNIKHLFLISIFMHFITIVIDRVLKELIW